jgi:DNA-binding NtrC family response regulator
LGGEATIDLDVRLIAATNKDLRAAIDAREFREDLYFRISTFRLRIQPLRERMGDILPLVAQSLARHAKGSVPLSVEPEAQSLLLQYPWPGNVRELENVVQRAVVLCTGRTITPAHLMFDESIPSLQSAALPAANNPATGASVDMATPLFELPEQQPSVPLAMALSSLNSAAAHSVADLASAMMSGAATHQRAVTPAWAMPNPSDSFMPSHMAHRSASGDNIQLPLDGLDLQHAVKASEHQMILSAIQTTESRVEAARKLGISPRTLRYKLAQLRERGMHLAFAD